jgi:uncharacterized protein
MDTAAILGNFLSPPILFFLLGVVATLVRSDLELPQPLPKVFSLYLLFAIGFKGGYALSQSGFTTAVFVTLGASVLMAVVVPLYVYYILKRALDPANAAAMAATYGSISAVTFITATAYLNNIGVTYHGYMVAAMALMESPAIMIGVLLARLNQPSSNGPTNWSAVGRDAFLNGSVFLLMGSLVVGLLTGQAGRVSMAPFTEGLFTGVLALFLLDMGIIAARRLHQLRRLGLFLGLFATLIPLLNAAIGLGIAWLIGLEAGDGLLFMILCASASYIAVPAAMRLAIPEANPSVYVTMALAVTFPFNILIGMPLYLAAARAVLPLPQ